jgi:hypothetical protein
MKAVSKAGLLFAVALVASAAVATAAQAISIHPNSTHIDGQAANPTLVYGSATVVCDTGTATGDTGIDNASITNLTVTFQGNCTVGGLSAVVTCSGNVTLTATSADGTGSGTGTVDLQSGFNCTVNVQNGFCTITVNGAQDPSAVNPFDDTTNTLAANVTVTATRTGNALCGPVGPQDASFTANYVISPNTVTITPLP